MKTQNVGKLRVCRRGDRNVLCLMVINDQNFKVKPKKLDFVCKFILYNRYRGNKKVGGHVGSSFFWGVVVDNGGFVGGI